MKTITPDELIEISIDQRPKVFFEIGRDVFPQIRSLHDDAGAYLCSPSFQPGKPDTLLGYPIKMVDGDGVRLITVVNDNVNIVRPV